MRLDQLERLRKLQAEICDVVIVEADPKRWPKTDTAQGRGDRYWLKKNAQASFALIWRIENLLALRDGRVADAPPGDQGKKEEADLEREIGEAEKEAAALGANVVAIRRGQRKAKR